jgi:phenylacetate-CoA ligase
MDTACSPEGWCCAIGAEAGLGATLIPISGGNTDRQIMIMKDFGVTCHLLHAQFIFLHLIERAREMDVEIRDLSIRVGVFGAEPWSESMRDRFEAESGIRAYDIYGLSEIIGPGVANECRKSAGSAYFMKTIFIRKSSIPKPGKMSPDGEGRRMVLTTLSK